MNILDALDDPKVFGSFFRAGTWAAWRVFLAGQTVFIPDILVGKLPEWLE